MKPVCRLTLGLVNRDGAWRFVQEHHSAPQKLEAPLKEGNH